jgi:hypothetical protein
MPASPRCHVGRTARIFCELLPKFAKENARCVQPQWARVRGLGWKAALTLCRPTRRATALAVLQRCAQTTIRVFPSDLTPRVWKIDLCLFEPSTSHPLPPPLSQCCWQPCSGFPLQSLLVACSGPGRRCSSRPGSWRSWSGGEDAGFGDSASKSKACATQPSGRYEVGGLTAGAIARVGPHRHPTTSRLVRRAPESRGG